VQFLDVPEAEIPIDDGAHGIAALHQQQVTWASREVSLGEERQQFGL
jgi:hypothetical protein